MKCQQQSKQGSIDGRSIARTKESTSSGTNYQKWSSYNDIVGAIKTAMQASIRTSWEQGTAAGAIIEVDDPQYSVFANKPFEYNGVLPVSALQFALSAAVRQTADGRLSQNINDAEDGAALDGASAGSAVLLGSFTHTDNATFWANSAERELDFILNKVPRTSTGAFSHRVDTKQYWADAVYMGPPFLAYYGAVTNNQTLLQLAYDNCRLYRDALLLDGPTGPLWAHIYDDGNKTWIDKGLWGTGNAWAATGMIRVAATIDKSGFGSEMKNQTDNLVAWVKEILDGEFAALTSENLVPDYVVGGATFGDCSSSAALSSVAYRGAKLWPDVFGLNYTVAADKIRQAVVSGVTDLGLLSPVVDPLNWGQVGILSTEGQAFGLMMLSAWKDLLGFEPAI
ncbi:Six-hairpin glycosidase [Neolentinus lepideus HHB14362 ss-1]|uniref:Six-hairpin glycosidase n=1 Tax=Neolentinus lepideus HHB14362 ss-1 TaxID=1314782 RepID=A0A165MJL2_9AGAM|nr:Six-hairpin glycosidase [Neolentinus lepideus HHB14362 ss-1]